MTFDKAIPSSSLKSARQSDLYQFLLDRHASDVIREGQSLRLRANPSLSIKKGYVGYLDFATGETGNAIDLLTRHLGYSFSEAMEALLGRTERPYVSPQTSSSDTLPKAALPPFSKVSAEGSESLLTLPEPAPGVARHLLAYLTQVRKIPAPLLYRLQKEGLLYQAKARHNVVFVNAAKTFAELRGTNPDYPFHQVLFSDPRACWAWNPSHTPPTTAYVCEGAIDALSLFLLLKKWNDPIASVLFCSIAGVANQQRIEALKAAGLMVILATDNDAAGEACRALNADCHTKIPERKDWNADWIASLMGPEKP